MADLVKVTIDGRETLVPAGTLIVEAARKVGVEIPVFCYHEKMHPVGACRMCLVEIQKVPRLQAACTTPVTDGMVVMTDTPAVDMARKGIIEILLCNHPLDCPVCDKGGECPLQDATLRHGSATTRFAEEKRRFPKPVWLSERILLDRERCIMCTRCVRFHREVVGDEALTILNRGNHSEIGTLPGRSFDSPFSGNVVELCPVGALTSASFRFRARSWELSKAPSICGRCSVGCNVRLESRAGELLRITSRENPDVDDGWLCDRGRFTLEPVNSPERLTVPLVRRDGALVPATWEEAIGVVARRLTEMQWHANGHAVAGLISPTSTNEELYLFQKLFREVLKSDNVDHGVHGDYTRPDDGPDAASGSIADLEDAAVIVVAGPDVLENQPVLGLRLRKAATKRGATLVSIASGPTGLARISRPWLRTALGGEVAVVRGLLRALLWGKMVEGARERLGDRFEPIVEEVATYSPERVRAIAGVSPEDLAETAGLIASARSCAIVFSRPLPGEPGALQEACRWLALLLAESVRPCWTYPLGAHANSQGAIDMGALPSLLPGHVPAPSVGLSGMRMMEAAAEGCLPALYVAGLDPVALGGEAASAALSRVGFLVVQDVVMTPTAMLASVVLPGAALAEKEGTLTNLERRVQRLSPAVPLPGAARPDWEIIAGIARALDGGWRYSSPRDVLAEIADTVAGYDGLTFEGLGERGRRWRRAGEAADGVSGDGHMRRLWYRPISRQVQETGA